MPQVQKGALRADEILIEIQIPSVEARTGTAYLKFPHPASGFAVVGVAAVVTVDAQRHCKKARIALTGVGPTAYRAKTVEDRLVGKVLDGSTIATAAEAAADGIEVNADIFASADYRAHLARVYTKRAIQQAGDRVQG